MQQTIDETNRRRCKQMAYNKAHHLVPRPIVKPIESNELVEMQRQRMAAKEGNISPVAMKVSSYNTTYYAANGETAIAAEPSATYGKANEETIEQKKVRLQKEMKKAAAAFDFITAAQLRDELLALDKK